MVSGRAVLRGVSRSYRRIIQVSILGSYFALMKMNAWSRSGCDGVAEHLMIDVLSEKSWRRDCH